MRLTLMLLLAILMGMLRKMNNCPLIVIKRVFVLPMFNGDMPLLKKQTAHIVLNARQLESGFEFPDEVVKDLHDGYKSRLNISSASNCGFVRMNIDSFVGCIEFANSSIVITDVPSCCQSVCFDFDSLDLLIGKKIVALHNQKEGEVINNEFSDGRSFKITYSFLLNDDSIFNLYFTISESSCGFTNKPYFYLYFVNGSELILGI